MTRLFTILALLKAVSLVLAPPALADSWHIIAPESSLGFTATQAGAPFSGRFKRFGASISFDPAHPEVAQVRATIDLTSATTGAEDRDSALLTPIWFNTEMFPQAVFEVSGFTPLEAGQFKADGTLTLKGVNQPVTLLFTLEIEGDTAHATGEAKIVRTNFDVGSGDFESGKWISKAVEVQLTLTARRAELGDVP